MAVSSDLSAREGTPSTEDNIGSIPSADVTNEKNEAVKQDVSAVLHDGHVDDSDRESKDVIIITGRDAALHLLPLRDDGDDALTFRSLFLASILACFQCVMYQIYVVRQQGSWHTYTSD
jgi:hypothetical protein